MKEVRKGACVLHLIRPRVITGWEAFIGKEELCSIHGGLRTVTAGAPWVVCDMSRLNRTSSQSLGVTTWLPCSPGLSKSSPKLSPSPPGSEHPSPASSSSPPVWRPLWPLRAISPPTKGCLQMLSPTWTSSLHHLTCLTLPWHLASHRTFYFFRNTHADPLGCPSMCRALDSSPRWL